MIARKGDYWEEYDRADLFLFTSNGVVSQGKLVMGAGTAKQMRDRYLGIDKAIGAKLTEGGYTGTDSSGYIYGLLISNHFPVFKVGAFQTKRHWKEKANLSLIHQSCDLLIKLIDEYSLTNVHLPYPGIGYGGLNKKDVESIIALLPDVVNVWEYYD